MTKIECNCRICKEELEEVDGIIDAKGNFLCSNCNDNYIWSFELDKYVEDV